MTLTKSYFLPLLSLIFLGCAKSSPPAESAASLPTASQSSSAEREVSEAPTSFATLDASSIQAAVRTKNPELRQCYIAGTFKDSELSGTVQVVFTIDPSGEVRAQSGPGSSMPDQEVVACVLDVFAQLKFPANGASPTEVTYPVRFGIHG